MAAPDRRRIATPPLANTPGIGFGMARRPASALHRPHENVFVASTI